ncbi:MAG: hypothetical protein RH862_05010 [Leptospiraceae bacterium]
MLFSTGSWATNSLATKLPRLLPLGKNGAPLLSGTKVGNFFRNTTTGRAMAQTAIDVNVTGLVIVPMEAFRSLRQGESYGFSDIPGSYMRGMGLGLVPSGVGNSRFSTPLQLGITGLYYGLVDYSSGIPEHGLTGNWQDRGTSALLTGLGGAYLHGFGRYITGGVNSMPGSTPGQLLFLRSTAAPLTILPYQFSWEVTDDYQ